MVETTKLGERYKITNLRFKMSARSRGRSIDRGINVEIDLNKRYQSFLGWGGAFTDAFGYVLGGLSDVTQGTLMKSYFAQDGLRYNFGRVHIGGCDFSLRNYSLDDLPDGQVDYNLTKWSLAYEDYHYKIPVIKAAQKLRRSHATDDLKLYGSSWSPPAWMKDNHNLVRGHLIDDPKIYQAYADYLVKFYLAYREQLGFDFWGGTVQNEPGGAFFPGYYFNSLELGVRQTQLLVGQYLGPTLARNGFTKDKFKLMIGDDVLGLINYLVPAIMADKDVQKYISGLAFHWYASGWQVPYDMLDECAEQISDKIDFLLMTEACAGWKKWLEVPVDLGSWDRGESYAVDIMQDVLRNSSGWVDWNLALRMDGGPNWANNTVDSPIIVNKEANEFYKQPMFYVLGHFSRFFLPGAIRVETEPSTGNFEDPFMLVAALNPKEDVLAVNVLNRHDHPIKINLNVKNTPGNPNYTLNDLQLQPRSINTITLKL